MSKIIASPPRFQNISVLRLPAIVGISRTIDCCRDTQFLSWIAQLPHHDQTLQQSKADNRSPFSFMHDHTSFHFGCKDTKCFGNSLQFMRKTEYSYYVLKESLTARRLGSEAVKFHLGNRVPTG